MVRRRERKWAPKCGWFELYEQTNWKSTSSRVGKVNKQPKTISVCFRSGIVLFTPKFTLTEAVQRQGQPALGLAVQWFIENSGRFMTELACLTSRNDVRYTLVDAVWRESGDKEV
jgi:hypothetical protein